MVPPTSAPVTGVRNASSPSSSPSSSPPGSRRWETASPRPRRSSCSCSSWSASARPVTASPACSRRCRAGSGSTSSSPSRPAGSPSTTRTTSRSSPPRRWSGSRSPRSRCGACVSRRARRDVPASSTGCSRSADLAAGGGRLPRRPRRRVADRITAVLDLDRCRFVPEPRRPRGPLLRRDGSVERDGGAAGRRAGRAADRRRDRAPGARPRGQLRPLPAHRGQPGAAPGPRAAAGRGAPRRPVRGAAGPTARRGAARLLRTARAQPVR